MPWMEDSKVEQRLQFILKVRQEGIPIKQACQHFDISRPTGYKWLDRYDEEGIEGLKDRSRAPDTIPHKTDEQTEEAICALRQQYPQFGPKKLRAWLCREHPDANWPAASTIGDILKRNGLIEERKTRDKTPPYTEPLGEATSPNSIWSADFKGQFELADGSLCYPLTITDNYSRMLLGCKALPSTKGQPVEAYMQTVFAEWGLPEAIRTDNGAPFASRAPHGLAQLSAWWTALGITHQRCEPGKPQQNGRHERMHLTLKQDTTRPAAETMAAQQSAFDRFQTFFNQLRPHEAIDQQTPASIHSRSPRRMPETLESLRYPHCDVTRTVKSNGYIKFGNTKIYVTEALGRFTVGLTETDVDVWVVSFADTHIGVFESGETSMTASSRQSSAHQTRV